MTAAKFSTREAALMTDPSGRELALPAAAASLRPKQVLFARYVSMGLSYTAAVRAAGYEPTTPESAKAQGSQLASDPRIAACIQVFTAAMVRSSGAGALKALNDVIADPKAKNADRIKAASKVLDKSQATRTAHEVQADIQHTHRVEEPSGQQRLAGLYAEVGLPIPPHLALAAPTEEPVDAHFEELEPAAAKVFADYAGSPSEEDPVGPPEWDR